LPERRKDVPTSEKSPVAANGSGISPPERDL
jgi:hypothetical protein